MKVKDLINKLKEYGDDMEVKIADVFEEYSPPFEVTKLSVSNYPEKETNKKDYVLIG